MDYCHRPSNWRSNGYGDMNLLVRVVLWEVVLLCTLYTLSGFLCPLDVESTIKTRYSGPATLRVSEYQYEMRVKHQRDLLY